VTAEPENPGVIGLRVPGAIGYRHLAIRVVSTACKMALDADPAAPGSDFESEVVSAFGEAFNNVAVHAYRDLLPGPVQIEVGWDDEMLFVTVVDHGRSFDPDTVSLPDLDELPEGGMGIFIMRSCMDEVEYKAGPPNVLRMVKRRARAGLLPDAPSHDGAASGPKPPRADARDHDGDASGLEPLREEHDLPTGDRASGVDVVEEPHSGKSGRSTPRMRAVVPEGEDGVVETSRRR
jgi:serine/threonine-protein kinase RsbW